MWEVMSEDWLKNRGFSARKLALLATLLDEEGVRQDPALKRIDRKGALRFHRRRCGCGCSISWNRAVPPITFPSAMTSRALWMLRPWSAV